MAEQNFSKIDAINLQYTFINVSDEQNWPYQGLAINFEEILTEICCDSDGNEAIKLVVLKWQSCQQIMFLQCVVACPFGTLFQHLTENRYN